MRAKGLCLGIACLGLCTLPARAVDLAKIERTIAKEPKYQSKPKYCLVVFGPEAAFRVWLVLDGKVLYVDKNGNGDLTEDGERVPPEFYPSRKFSFRPGKVGPDAKTQYHLIRVHAEADHSAISVALPNRRYARAGENGPDELVFAERAQDAPIVHFFGPLTFQRFSPQPGSICIDWKPVPWVRGQDNHLAVDLGTPGLGNGTFARHDFDTEAYAQVDLGNSKTFKVHLNPES